MHKAELGNPGISTVVVCTNCQINKRRAMLLWDRVCRTHASDRQTPKHGLINDPNPNPADCATAMLISPHDKRRPSERVSHEVRSGCSCRFKVRIQGPGN